MAANTSATVCLLFRTSTRRSSSLCTLQRRLWNQICSRNHSTTTMAPYLPLDNAVNLHIMESEPASAPRKHPLLVLHGLLGSSSNFRSIALKGKLAEDRYAAAVDLRNHGYSPHTETMTIEEMAADVAHTIRTKNMQPVHLLGHSLVRLIE